MLIQWSDGANSPNDASLNALPGRAAAGEEMDARVFARDGELVRAWASVWWKHTPSLNDEKLGTIGGFGALDEQAAAFLLEACCSKLSAEGCSRIVGPMNGNTWRSYRFVVEDSGRGAFFMEPRNPPDYPAWWRAAGFVEIAGYSSSAIALDGRATVPAALAGRLAACGVVIRDLKMDDYDAELAAIHAVTLEGFSENFLYTPLGETAFLNAYRKIRERVDPRFVRIAEKDGKAIGYVFAIADLEAAARGEKPALIIKTLTVDPTAKCAGLGSLLVDEIQQRAHAAGFREALHALQFDGNNVLRITRRHAGERIRRYALFFKVP